MKRNLFAIFLALALVVALAFVVAPSAKAIEVSENTSIEVKESCTIDLNGHNVTVNVNNEGDEPIVISVVDNGNRGKDGLSAGKLTIGTVTGSYAIETVSKDPDANMRYLKVDNGDTTYSFHPFNLVLKQIGINTGKDALCLQAMFIANDKVQEKLSAKGVVYGEGEWAIDDLKIGATGADSKGDSGKYSSTNGIGYGYYDLMGSLADQTAIEKTRTFRAYITVDGEPIYSDNIATFSPKTVLETLNEKVNDFSPEQRAKMKTMITSMENYDHLKFPCHNFLNLAISYQYEKVTDIADVTTGNYVMVATNGYAPNAFDNNWLQVVQPTIGGDVVTDAKGAVVELTVSGSTAKLKVGGSYILGKNENKVYTGDFSWNLKQNDDGTFSFGYDADFTRMLASNIPNANKIRCYQTTTITGTNSKDYVATFDLYRETAILVCDHSVLTSEATCTEGAVCALCGNVGEALGHDDTTPATCQTSATCSRCGTHGDPNPDAHTEGTAATCMSQATCKDCGASYGSTNSNNHIDDDTDHICDYGCGKDDIGTCADGDDDDILCDYGCGKEYSEGVLTEKTYSYTFTKIFTSNGTKSLGGVNWTFNGTGSTYFGSLDGTKGQQFGSKNSPFKSITLTSASFSNVKSIKINTSGASGVNASFTVSIGGTQVGSSTKVTTTATTYEFTPDTALTGEVAFTYTISARAIYIKSIEIEYAE